jgi:hypothetical protein
MNGLTLTRRRLIQAASAGAALHVFGGAAFAQSARDAVRGAILPLSVGYLEDSDLLPSLSPQPWRRRAAVAEDLRVVPAERMAIGDQSLAQGTVEMRVHGFYPGIPPRRLASFSAVVLTVFFPSFDPIEPGPFPYYSWQGKHWPGPSKSPPNRFLVPLRDDGGLELVVEMFDGRPTPLGQGAARVLRGSSRQAPMGTPVGQTSLYTDFTVDWYAGRPKLQRGFYLLGLSPDAWRAPARLEEPGSKSEVLERTSLVVSFEGVPEDDPRLVAAAT